ncbi:MAG: glycine zipper 2TM domain-containing protein [bacterium]|nr:glycine zipper 2TM domain-containing protein [bacterium]
MKFKILSVAITTLISTAAFAGNYNNGDRAHVYNAFVQDVQINYRNVNRTQRVCDNNVTQQRQGSNSSPLGLIIGGVAGGLLGNQVGGGNGRVAATAVGAVVGSAVGNNMQNQNQNNVGSEINNNGSCRDVTVQDRVPTSRQVVLIINLEGDEQAPQIGANFVAQRQ